MPCNSHENAEASNRDEKENARKFFICGRFLTLAELRGIPCKAL